MMEKEESRVKEAINYLKDWLHFLEASGWETVELNNYFGQKLYACLKLLIEYAEKGR